MTTREEVIRWIAREIQTELSSGENAYIRELIQTIHFAWSYGYSLRQLVELFKQLGIDVEQEELRLHIDNYIIEKGRDQEKKMERYLRKFDEADEKITNFLARVSR